MASVTPREGTYIALLCGAVCAMHNWSDDVNIGQRVFSLVGDGVLARGASPLNGRHCVGSRTLHTGRRSPRTRPCAKRSTRRLKTTTAAWRSGRTPQPAALDSTHGDVLPRWPFCATLLWGPALSGASSQRPRHGYGLSQTSKGVAGGGTCYAYPWCRCRRAPRVS